MMPLASRISRRGDARWTAAERDAVAAVGEGEAPRSGNQERPCGRVRESQGDVRGRTRDRSCTRACRLRQLGRGDRVAAPRGHVDRDVAARVRGQTREGHVVGAASDRYRGPCRVGAQLLHVDRKSAGRTRCERERERSGRDCRIAGGRYWRCARRRTEARRGVALDRVCRTRDDGLAAKRADGLRTITRRHGNRGGRPRE